MKKLRVVGMVVLWWGAGAAISSAQDFSVARSGDYYVARTAEGEIIGMIPAAALADTVYEGLTIVATSYLDSVNLSRTNLASQGTGAWRILMVATSHDSISRYVALIKNIPRMQAPLTATEDSRVLSSPAPEDSLRYAYSGFDTGSPVFNSGLVFAALSSGYQNFTFQFPSVAASINQFVKWISLKHGDTGTFEILVDQIRMGSVLVEDGESGPGGGDVTPPAAPTAVDLRPLSSTSVEGEARAPADSDVNSLLFQVSPDPAFVNQVQQVWSPANPNELVRANFFGWQPGTLLYLRVAARDLSGNLGPFSAVDTARTFPIGSGEVQPPVNFTLTGISDTRVRASYTNGANAFQTEIRVAEGFMVGDIYTVQVVPALGVNGQVEFGGFQGGTLYAGQARSIHQDGTFSAFTATDTALTFPDQTGPSRVLDLVADPISSTQVEVRFTVPVDEDVMAANIHVSPTPDFQIYKVRQIYVSSGMLTRVVVPELDPGTIYWCREVTLDWNNNESLPSNVDTVRTFGAVTAIGSNEQIPESFGLTQNYPNPFNPSTRIVYQMAAASRVTLSVYDVFGRKVRELVNEEKLPGEHEAIFDASDFPSGVYFCRMTAGNFTATKKMLLIR